MFVFIWLDFLDIIRVAVFLYFLLAASVTGIIVHDAIVTATVVLSFITLFYVIVFSLFCVILFVPCSCLFSIRCCSLLFVSELALGAHAILSIVAYFVTLVCLGGHFI
jgi:hypothetical protein